MFAHCHCQPFNVVEHRHEHDSSFENTQFRGSQECWNFSHDLKRYVARKYANESTWLARDIVLVRDVIRSDTSEILVAHASFAMEL